MKCAPKIWKKLGATEKVWWTDFYRSFLDELKADAVNGGTLTPKQREVIAHNCACHATWQMGAVMHRVFKALKGSK